MYGVQMYAGTDGDLPEDASYTSLFHCRSSPERMAAVANPESIERLLGALRAGSTPVHTRFLIAEILFAVEPSFPSAEDRAALPVIYAEVLAQGGDGNPWGMPGFWDESATKHLVALVKTLGKPGLPVLRPLLSNDRRVGYTGSQRATLGEAYQIRVKDIAAHIAAAILGEPFPVAHAPDERDKTIVCLAAAMEAP